LGTSSAGTLVSNSDATNRSFAGTFEGAFTFNRAGANTLTLTNSSPLFTGNLLVNNGTLQLQDFGALTGMTGGSSVDVDHLPSSSATPVLPTLRIA